MATTISDRRPIEYGGRKRGMRAEDLMWTGLWALGLLALLTWDLLFLNRPALDRLSTAALNSCLGGLQAVAGAMGLGWILGVTLHLLDVRGWQWARRLLTVLIGVLRSIPQILGVLAGYVLLTALVRSETLMNASLSMTLIAACISLMLLPEAVDLIDDRLRYFRTHDFVPALRCCGMNEFRIANVEILWKNSRSHLYHAAIALFGSALFLQCSVDFVVSVGLAGDASLTNIPLTLGNMLARLDSKQDILAIGVAFRDLAYVPILFTRHLQGLSTAVVILYSLFCVHKIAGAYVLRNGL